MSIKHDGYSIDTDPNSPTLGQVTPPPSTENNTRTETNTEKVVEDGQVKDKVIKLDHKNIKGINPDGTAMTGNEEKGVDPLPNMDTNVEPVDQESVDAYGGGGEPQSVERDEYEPQSSGDEDKEEDDDDS